jgi:TRAP-type C4-dicarboxylate transport system substrate-binding protein
MLFFPARVRASEKSRVHNFFLAGKEVDMKKSLYLGVVLVVAAAIVGALSASSRAEQKEFDLKLDQWLPATHWYQDVAAQFIKEVEIRTNGLVKIRQYKGGALGSGKEALERTEKGMEDIGSMVGSYTPGRFDLNTIVELPFAFPDIGTAYDVGNEMYRLSPELQSEFKTVRMLFVHHAGMQDIATRGKAIRTVKDFEGIKLRSPGGAVAQTLEALGAVPVLKPSSESYMAMQRRVVDGGIMYAASVPGYKLQEVTDYFTVVGVSVSSVYYIINPKTWESLPDYVKVIFNDVANRCSQMACLNYQWKYDEGIEVMKKAGVEIIKLPPEEIAKLREKAMPVWHEWVDKMENKGKPGKKVMKLFKELLAKRGIIVK